LTIESEGIGLLAGAHLGGQRAVLAMQSSGVGNCINLLSLIQIAQFPFVALVSMRGDFGEQNAWQYPMGQATEATLQAMNVRCYWVHQPDDVVPTVTAAVNAAYAANQATAVLLSQKLIGAKPF
jgi:sulfopyruvate decarboxylase alpha subunit